MGSGCLRVDERSAVDFADDAIRRLSGDIPVTPTAWERIVYTVTTGASNITGTGRHDGWRSPKNAAGNLGDVYTFTDISLKPVPSRLLHPDHIGGGVARRRCRGDDRDEFFSWWNASAGTFVAEFDGPASGTRPIIAVDDNTANEVIMLYGQRHDPKATVTDGGPPQADIDAGTLVANTSASSGSRSRQMISRPASTAAR